MMRAILGLLILAASLPAAAQSVCPMPSPLIPVPVEIDAAGNALVSSFPVPIALIPVPLEIDSAGNALVGSFPVPIGLIPVPIEIDATGAPLVASFPMPGGLIPVQIEIDEFGNFLGCLITQAVPSVSLPGLIALAIALLAISAVALRRIGPRAA